jgi:hypothetical protein
MQPQYPTQWSHGKPRGSIRSNPASYSVIMSPPGGKQTCKTFPFKNDEDKEDVYKKANAYLFAESDRLGFTRNQIRYLDADTMEVKVIHDFVMKTDANLLKYVEMYPLNVKAKKEGLITRNYVMYQDKKIVHPFTKLICNYKIVEYINGDTMDLTSKNLKEFGSISEDNKILITNQNLDMQEYDIKNSFNYFNMEINDLPKNIWLLGRPSGTVFKRGGENIYSSRVEDKEGTGHTKTFSIDKYNSDNEAYQVALKWQVETSYSLGVTSNLIKILDNDTILVQLTKGQVMKTNKIFIPLLKKIFLSTIEGGNKNAQPYAYASFNNISTHFHNLITCFNMVDHIDGDPLNNCLENLRNADSFLNNKNKHDANITKGVKLKKIGGSEHYTVAIKFNTLSCTKNFSVEEHGKEPAKELATSFIKNFYGGKKFESCIIPEDDQKLVKIELAKLECILKLANDGVINDRAEYIKKLTKDDTPNDNKKNLKNLGISDDDLNKIFDYYVAHQVKYIQWLDTEHKKVSAFIN